jgi:hypothetical protein
MRQSPRSSPCRGHCRATLSLWVRANIQRGLRRAAGTLTSRSIRRSTLRLRPSIQPNRSHGPVEPASRECPGHDETDMGALWVSCAPARQPAAARPSDTPRCFMCGWPPPRTRFRRRGTGVACSHVSGLLMQYGRTAGPDGFRASRSHHSNGIAVPMKRQASSIASDRPTVPSRFTRLSQALVRRRFMPQQPYAGNSLRGASPPRRCVPSCSPGPPRRPTSAAVGEAR